MSAGSAAASAAARSPVRGPSVDDRDEAVVGFTALRDPVPLLVGAQLVRRAAGLLQRLAQSPGRATRRHMRAPGASPPRLVQHRRHHRRQLGGFQARPTRRCADTRPPAGRFRCRSAPATGRRRSPADRVARRAMKPRSVSSPTIRSNVRANELVAAATFCCDAARCHARCADNARPAGPAPRGRARCGRDGGAAASRNDASSGSDSRSCPVAAACAAPGTVSPAAADRSADARSRRTRGCRCSTRLGNVIEPTGADAPE